MHTDPNLSVKRIFVSIRVHMGKRIFYLGDWCIMGLFMVTPLGGTDGVGLPSGGRK
jgi:hypothetical protein